MKKVFAAILALLLSVPVFAEYPSAPDPKPEAVAASIKQKTTFFHRDDVKFGEEVLFFGGSVVAQVLAEHSGAKKCKDEALRAGIPWAANASSTGFRPDNADKRELELAAGVYATAGVAYLTGHRTAARNILTYGGAAAYGGAFATWWGTCN